MPNTKIDTNIFVRETYLDTLYDIDYINKEDTIGHVFLDIAKDSNTTYTLDLFAYDSLYTMQRRTAHISIDSNGILKEIYICESPLYTSYSKCATYYKIVLSTNNKTMKIRSVEYGLESDEGVNK